MKISTPILSGILIITLVGCVVPVPPSLASVSNIGGIPKDAMTDTNMTVVEHRIREYYKLHGKLPENLKDLPAIAGRSRELVDGWERPLQYFKDADKSCRLVSMGADGTLGGSEQNTDIVQVVDIVDWE